MRIINSKRWAIVSRHGSLFDITVQYPRQESFIPQQRALRDGTTMINRLGYEREKNLGER